MLSNSDSPSHSKHYQQHNIVTSLSLSRLVPSFTRLGFASRSNCLAGYEIDMLCSNNKQGFIEFETEKILIGLDKPLPQAYTES